MLATGISSGSWTGDIKNEVEEEVELEVFANGAVTASAHEY